MARAHSMTRIELDKDQLCEILRWNPGLTAPQIVKRHTRYGLGSEYGCARDKAYKILTSLEREGKVVSDYVDNKNRIWKLA